MLERAKRALTQILPKQAGAPAPIQSGILEQPGKGPTRGSKQLIEAYNTMPWLRAIVNNKARSVGKINWRIYAVRDQGTGKARKIKRLDVLDKEQRDKELKNHADRGELEEIEDHPLLDVLFSGNQMIPGVTNFQLCSLYKDLVGQSYYLMERDDLGVPVALWPLPPDWIQESAPAGSGRAFKVRFESMMVEIPESEILQIQEPDPVNPYGRGSGIARSLGDELETDEYAAKHTSRFFQNNMRPDFVVTMENAGREEGQAFEKQWHQNFAGFWNRFKPLITNKKIELKEITQDFRSTQFIELRKFERDTIRQVFGMPPEMLGVTESSNRATIESADFIWNKNVIEPEMDTLRAYLQARLVPLFDDRIVLDFDSPVSEDKDFKLSVYKEQPMAFKFDEWRKLAGEPPLGEDEGGENFPSKPTAVTVSSLAGKHKSAQKQDGVMGLDETALFETMDNPEMWGIVANELQKLVQEFGAEEMTAAGANVAFQETERVAEFMRQFSSERVQLVNETTKEQIRSELAEGISQGEAMSALTARVNEVFDEADAVRAQRVAQTETVRSVNFGALEGMKQAGVKRKQWLATADNKVRSAHAQLDGNVVEVQKPFTYLGATAQAPGQFGVAELDINCRCTITSVFNNQQLSVEGRREMWKSREIARLDRERGLIGLIQQVFKRQRDDIVAKLPQAVDQSLLDQNRGTA